MAAVYDLAPGSDLRLLFLDEPRIVDRHEPLRYPYSACSFSGERPASAGATDIASRATALLGSAGLVSGDVGGERRRQAPHGGHRPPRRQRHRDPCGRPGAHRVVQRADAGDGLVRAQEFPWPEPVRTAETVTPAANAAGSASARSAVARGNSRSPGCRRTSWAITRNRAGPAAGGQPYGWAAFTPAWSARQARVGRFRRRLPTSSGSGTTRPVRSRRPGRCGCGGVRTADGGASTASSPC